jgi:hypothetical protein
MMLLHGPSKNQDLLMLPLLHPLQLPQSKAGMTAQKTVTTTMEKCFFAVNRTVQYQSF